MEHNQRYFYSSPGRSNLSSVDQISYCRRSELFDLGPESHSMYPHKFHTLCLLFSSFTAPCHKRPNFGRGGINRKGQERKVSEDYRFGDWLAVVSQMLNQKQMAKLDGNIYIFMVDVDMKINGANPLLRCQGVEDKICAFLFFVGQRAHSWYIYIYICT